MDWALRLMESLGYAGIAIIVALENLFPPIPSEIVLPFAGFLTRRSTLTVPGAIAASTIGSLIGALILYGLGRVANPQQLYRIARNRYSPINEADLRKAGRWFDRYGPWTVLFCRMVPTLRSLISIPAGLVRMSPPVFLLYTLAGTLVWNSALVGIGAALGAAWHRVTFWLDYYDRICLFLLAFLALAVLAWLMIRRRKERRGKNGGSVDKKRRA